MVVEGLTRLASKILGPEIAFNVVAEIVANGSKRGFKTLLEEAEKEGIKLAPKSLDDILAFEVRYRRQIVEATGIRFQTWDDTGKVDGKWYLYTKHCVYQDLVRENPSVCAVCIGLISGMLEYLGYRISWIYTPERINMMCAKKDRPEYVIYRDPHTTLPECRIVIEKLRCR